MIAIVMLNRTIPYFWRTSTLRYVLGLLLSSTVPAYRTVLSRTSTFWGKTPETVPYRTTPPREGYGGTVGAARSSVP